MKISKDEVKRIARLAKLEFEDDALVAMQHDLERIVGFVEKLAEVDVTGVAETAHVQDMANVFRDDKVGKQLSNEEALANAPSRKMGYFSVPKVIRS